MEACPEPSRTRFYTCAHFRAISEGSAVYVLAVLAKRINTPSGEIRGGDVDRLAGTESVCIECIHLQRKRPTTSTHTAVLLLTGRCSLKVPLE